MEGVVGFFFGVVLMAGAFGLIQDMRANAPEGSATLKAKCEASLPRDQVCVKVLKWVPAERERTTTTPGGKHEQQ